MLYLLLSLFSVVLLLLGWGNLFEKILADFWNGISAKLFRGILCISVLSSIVAFFAPLNIQYEIVIIFIGVLGLLKNRSNVYNDLGFLRNKTFLLFAFIVIVITTFAPFINDHFSYYLSTISWLNDFGLVKGISNVSLILGQQSTWHIFQSSIDTIIDPFMRVNATVLLLFVLYAIENKQKELLVLVPLFLLFVQSPSPDLIIYTISMIITLELLKTSPNYTSLWLVSLFLCTIKPTVFWLPIFVFVLAIKENSKSLFSRNNILFSVSIILPFFTKQLWCFGDILFPLQTNFFALDWSPHAQLLESSNKIAVLKTYDFQYKYAEIVRWNSVEQIYRWFTLSGFKSIIHFYIILTLLAFGIVSFVKRNKNFVVLWVCIFLKTIVIFYISGQYRFMLDGILILTILLITCVKIPPKYFFATSLVGCGVVFMALLFPPLLQENVKSFRGSRFMNKPEMKQFYKPLESSTVDFHEISVTNFVFYTPNKKSLMFGTPIPCISKYDIKKYSEFGIFPVAYDSINLDKGFYFKTLSQKEHEKIRTIESKYPKLKRID